MSFDLGATVPIKFINYDSTGTPANAGSGAVITVTLPDATTQTPTVTAAGSGVYTATGPSTIEGHYTVRYVSTGTNASTATDAYDVRATSSLWLMSFAEAKACLNQSKTINDVELGWYLDATTALIEGRIGQVIVRSCTETVKAGETIVLGNTPVVSVTSLTPVTTGGTVIVSADLVIDYKTGTLRKANRSCFWDDTYTAVYTAGTGVTPAVAQAARITLQHLWMNQRGNAPTRDGDTYTTPFSLPNAAREILDPLITPGIG